MDETQQTIVGSAGAVGMAGGIAWAATWWLAAKQPSYWRLAPAVAMFVIGLFAFVWAFHRNLRKEALGRLDEFLIEGNVIVAHTSFDTELRRLAWSTATSFFLSRAMEPAIAESFLPNDESGLSRNPGSQSDSRLVVQWQIQALKTIRDGVADRSIVVLKGWRR